MAFNARDLAVNGVRALQPYLPGKPVEELERDLGLSDIVKLASNENPRTSNEVIAKALAQQQSDISRYTDGSGYALKVRLSDLLGVSTNQITIGNGSNDVLELLVRDSKMRSSAGLPSEAKREPLPWTCFPPRSSPTSMPPSWLPAW